MRRKVLRLLLVLAVLAAAIAPASSSAAPGYAVEGLKIRPPLGAFGGIPVGSCDLVTYVGCRTRTFTLDNVGDQTIRIGGYGIADLDPLIAALVPVSGACSSLPLVGGYWALQPGASCVIVVAFSPTQVGRMENDLHVWYLDQFDPIAVIPLFGIGT